MREAREVAVRAFRQRDEDYTVEIDEGLTTTIPAGAGTVVFAFAVIDGERQAVGAMLGPEASSVTGEIAGQVAYAFARAEVPPVSRAWIEDAVAAGDADAIRTRMDDHGRRMDAARAAYEAAIAPALASALARPD